MPPVSGRVEPELLMIVVATNPVSSVASSVISPRSVEVPFVSVAVNVLRAGFCPSVCVALTSNLLGLTALYPAGVVFSTSRYSPSSIRSKLNCVSVPAVVVPTSTQLSPSAIG